MIVIVALARPSRAPVTELRCTVKVSLGSASPSGTIEPAPLPTKSSPAGTDSGAPLGGT